MIYKSFLWVFELIMDNILGSLTVILICIVVKNVFFSEKQKLKTVKYKKKPQEQLTLMDRFALAFLCSLIGLVIWIIVRIQFQVQFDLIYTIASMAFLGFIGLGDYVLKIFGLIWRKKAEPYDKWRK